MTLLFDKLADYTNTCQIAAKGVPLRRIVLASVVSTASIAKNDLKKPMKKQCVSALIPSDYKPSAKCVPGIAGWEWNEHAKLNIKADFLS